MKFILLLLLFVGCQNITLRSSYSLVELGPYLVTNSQNNPYIAITKLGEYYLIVKNNSNTKQKIDTANSVLVIDEKQEPISCIPATEGFEIAPGAQKRIDCQILLSQKLIDQLKGTDSIINLQINLGPKLTFVSNYKIFSEDL